MLLRAQHAVSGLSDSAKQRVLIFPLVINKLISEKNFGRFHKPIFLFLQVSQYVVVFFFQDAKYGAGVKVLQHRFVVVRHGHIRTTSTEQRHQ